MKTPHHLLINHGLLITALLCLANIHNRSTGLSENTKQREIRNINQKYDDKLLELLGRAKQ